jgi:hypothetical protein
VTTSAGIVGVGNSNGLCAPPHWTRPSSPTARGGARSGQIPLLGGPTSGAFTMPRLSQAYLLGYTPSSQQAFQGDATHQAQRRP